MRFWHKKPEPVIIRSKKIDWSKVTTLDDVILILRNFRSTKDIMVDEKYWKDPSVAKLLGSIITESTYDGAAQVKQKVYEE